MKMIVLTGMPASGKSTLAGKLSSAFQFPVLEKDAIKEELFDVLGFECYAQKRKMDHAANAVLLRCAERFMEGGSSVILDNNFDTESAGRLAGLLERYDCRCVTVFLGGDSDVFYERYVERDRLHKRHLGHVLQEHFPPREGDSLDYTMTRDEFAEKFEKRGTSQVKILGPRIDVDATYPDAINVDVLIEQIKGLLLE